MSKHVNPSADLAPLTVEIARILGLEAVRPFDGHLFVDFTTEDGKIGGRVLHAHDSSEVVTFGIQVTVS